MLGELPLLLATLEGLQRDGAITDATYLWWDVRLQPRVGTLEVWIMALSDPRSPAARVSAR